MIKYFNNTQEKILYYTRDNQNISKIDMTYIEEMQNISDFLYQDEIEEELIMCGSLDELIGFLDISDIVIG